MLALALSRYFCKSYVVRSGGYMLALALSHYFCESYVTRVMLQEMKDERSHRNNQKHFKVGVTSLTNVQLKKHRGGIC